MKIRIVLIIGILLSASIKAQETEKKPENLKHAEQLLEYALKKNFNRTQAKFKLIPNKENAISYAEIILFELYGKETIEAEKPYKIYLIDDYWIVTGSLPTEMVGGVFEMVFDSWNGKVLMIEHGK